MRHNQIIFCQKPPESSFPLSKINLLSVKGIDFQDTLVCQKFYLLFWQSLTCHKHFILLNVVGVGETSGSQWGPGETTQCSPNCRQGETCRDAHCQILHNSQFEITCKAGGRQNTELRYCNMRFETNC